MTTTPQRLLLIDGHSMAFRAFYATSHQTSFVTRSGVATNAVYVFCTMLRRLLRTHEPDRVAVAFDTHAPTFRKDAYPAYKEGRRETPREFIGQVDLIIEALHALGIVATSRDGIEADDILATLATQGADAGMEVLVASGDRDVFQLVSDRVSVLYPGQSMSDMRLVGPDEVEKKYGVTPARYRELAALVGEKADNLPGVEGVGAVTAAKWINAYPSLAALLDDAAHIRGKRGAALEAARADVERNYELNRLLTDVDLGLELDDLGVGAGEQQAWNDLCDTLEFTQLRESMWQAVAALRGTAVPTTIERSLTLARAGADGVSVSGWLEAHESGTIGIALEDVRGEASTLALGAGDDALVIDLVGAGPEDEHALADLLATQAERLAYLDVKLASHLLHAAGFAPAQPGIDVALAAYLLKPEARSYDVATLAETYLGRGLPERLSGDGDLLGGSDEALAWQAQAIADLGAVLGERVAALEQETLLDDVEMPLAFILASMEERGIAVASARLDELHADLTHEVEQARARALEIAGRPTLNLSSPKQLQEVLFEQFQMPPTRKTKRGYTTNAEALQDLYAQTEHPFLAYLLEHRDKIKLQQTVDGLIREIADDGRIHTTFQQTVTATGRLSSTSPNLQNIPARTEAGLVIRSAFTAGEGYEGLLTADYSQIEMRVMAHMSGDPGLTEAFDLGEDLHTSMAALVFGIEPGEVTHAQRTRIKATSYGLAYGLSAYGLSRQLGIGRAEASELRDAYFARFGGVRDYLDGIVREATRTGYTTTLLGRRRYLPDLRSDSRTARQMAERAALNAPIQGSAADIIKLAMIGVERALGEAGLRSRMLLQVHDELIVEVADGEREQVSDLVRDTMAHAVDLAVPLEVSLGFGPDWRAAAH